MSPKILFPFSAHISHMRRFMTAAKSLIPFLLAPHFLSDQENIRAKGKRQHFYGLAKRKEQIVNVLHFLVIFF